MEDFLRRIKLIDDMSLRLNVTTTEFVSKLRSHVDEEDINSLFSGLFEAFSSSKKKYKGEVDSRGFHIRKKRQLFKKQRMTAYAKGNYRLNGDILVVNAVINPFNFNKILLKGFLFICYLTFLFYLIFDEVLLKDLFNNLPIPFLLFGFVAMFVMPYFSLRRSVSNMKDDLEKQFLLFVSEINR